MTLRRLPWPAGPVRIERLRASDADAVAAYRSDPAVQRYQGWGAGPYPLESARRLIDEVATAAVGRPGHAAQLAVRDRADDTLLGDVYVSVDVDAPRTVELGVTLARAAQGQGRATAALTRVIDELFATGTLDQAVAWIHRDNGPSRRLFERLGFRAVAALDDDVQYTLARTAWVGAPASDRQDMTTTAATDAERDDARDAERAIASMIGPDERLGPPAGIDTIGFDADDTLWHNEDDFRASEQMLAELLAPYLGTGPDVDAHLLAVERANLEVFGYGVKGFLLSMIETAITLTEGRIRADEIHTLIERGKAMIRRPVELLDGVEQTLAALRGRYRLVLITLGDLFHQEQKIAASGLAPYFDHVEIVSEKDAATYRRILDRHGIDPSRFLMVGNSMRSDIVPVLAVGGHAVHVPYHLLWAHQAATCEHPVPTLESLAALPRWLDAVD